MKSRLLRVKILGPVFSYDDLFRERIRIKRGTRGIATNVGISKSAVV